MSNPEGGLLSTLLGGHVNCSILILNIRNRGRGDQLMILDAVLIFLIMNNTIIK